MKLRLFKCSLIFIIIFSLIMPTFAAGTGKLNVFTDLAEAEIYVDGQLAGKEAVVGYVLSIGTHLVKVVYNGKTVFSKTVEIEADRTNTITSEHFVNIKTSTPSRGAVEVEAERLREYRGNACFGFLAGSPTTGLSVKWWFSKDYGIQAIGFAMGTDSLADQAFGARILYGFPKKIFSEEVLDAYMAIGTGRFWHTDKAFSLNNKNEETWAIAFGVEASLGRLANALFLTEHYISDDAEDSLAFLGRLISLGLLNIAYSSFEMGMESKTIYSGGSSEIRANMFLNFGLHYYF